MSTCTRCGASFSCGPVDMPGDPALCWCTALPLLPPEKLVEGEACLCPACLKQALAEAKAG